MLRKGKRKSPGKQKDRDEPPPLLDSLSITHAREQRAERNPPYEGAAPAAARALSGLSHVMVHVGVWLARPPLVCLGGEGGSTLRRIPGVSGWQCRPAQRDHREGLPGLVLSSELKGSEQKAGRPCPRVVRERLTTGHEAPSCPDTD